MSAANARRERLEHAHLYLVCPILADLERLLDRALAGGVDLVQLRDKDADDDALLTAGETMRRACAGRALFIVNDRPDLARALGADGVHVGQDDMAVAEARGIVGDGGIVGLSTHSRDQIDAAGDGPDYIAVGPVHATPTKPGRPAVGLELVRYAAARADRPWFAIGGLDATNVHEVVEAGARRIVVVRAITEADDPGAAARGLRDALERTPVGPA